MEGKFKLLTEAVCQSSRFMIRDYYELEELQTHSKRNDMFVKKSCTHLMTQLNEAAGKFYKKLIYSEKEATDIFNGDASSAPQEVALIEVLDGIGNLTKGMPYFSTMVTVLQKEESGYVPTDVFINFPALHEYYFACKGKGAWKEKFTGKAPGKYRIKVSGVQSTDILTAGCSINAYAKAYKHTEDIRIFGCSSLMYSMLASGKLDLVITEERTLTKSGFELLVNEAGGATNLSDGKLFASSMKIMQQLEV